MKLGFYGDSYCNLFWDKDPNYRKNPATFTERKNKLWAGRLIDDYGSEVTSSGLGGSSLFYAVDCWKKDIEKFNDNPYDVVFFTFTWWERLYTPYSNYNPVFLAKAERRPIPESGDPNVNFNEIDHSIDLYYKYMCHSNEQKFYYELMIKWILDLPTQYPNTKFIFLPCTEFARETSLKHFTLGTLVNFSFETLSNLETGSPGPMPINCGRSGHLNDRNHEEFTALMKYIIDDNISGIVDPDFTNFDLSEIPSFNT